MNATTITLLGALTTLITLITLITLVALRAARREIESLYKEIRALRREVSREADASSVLQDRTLTLLLKLREENLLFNEVRYGHRREAPLVAPRSEAQREETMLATNPVELGLEPVQPSLKAIDDLLGQD